MLAWLRSWLVGADTDDGLGFSFAKEVRLAARVRKLRATPVTWRTPDDTERQEFNAHAVIGRFGDDTIAIADIADHKWIVRERMWFGWPDPPEFVAFAFADDDIWAAADFDGWPDRWTGVGRSRTETARPRPLAPE